MTRTLLTLLTALLISPAAFAADDGGFGTNRFANQAPAALAGEEPSSDALAAGASDPSQIEPAAGNDEADADAGLQVEAPPVTPDSAQPAQ